ncbi:MAG TPA: discoidin domain-containing protein [Candidatus Hydrogenedentes bacterium]|nr:discoidin domain-containing protein [Candidatus Hydrogenedentota bacterium]HPG66888.1 discoidin domain-containing protein [Candidatus Hydrogenedentota bacterium]
MKTSTWLVVLSVCTLFVAMMPAQAAEGDGGLVPLKLKLPKPMFIGTPKNIQAPNLEKAGTKHQPVMVPADAVNLALEKSVTSSDNEPIIGDLEQITDGDKEGADGSFVELGPDVQWVQIDLGQACEVYAVVVWHYHSQARVYNDVVIQCADDADFIENVKTLYSNDHDNSAGLGVGKEKAYIETNEGYQIDAKGAKTQYIRLYSNRNTSNDMNHYIEVEVYGRPAS